MGFLFVPPLRLRRLTLMPAYFEVAIDGPSDTAVVRKGLWEASVRHIAEWLTEHGMGEDVESGPEYSVF
jgi:hypothetical protein